MNRPQQTERDDPGGDGAEIHPYSGAAYRRAPDGSVLVALRGKTGRFRWDGRWLSGELRHADPHFCLWVAGGYGGPPTPELSPR